MYTVKVKKIREIFFVVSVKKREGRQAPLLRHRTKMNVARISQRLAMPTEM
jgi:hypothetical protein